MCRVLSTFHDPNTLTTYEVLKVGLMYVVVRQTFKQAYTYSICASVIERFCGKDTTGKYLYMYTCMHFNRKH